MQFEEYREYTVNITRVVKVINGLLGLELHMCQSWYNSTEKGENLQEAKYAWKYIYLGFIEAARQ